MVAKAHFKSAPRAISDAFYGLCQVDKVVAESSWLPRPWPVVPPLANSLRVQLMIHLRMAMGESETIEGLVSEHPGWPE